MFQRRKARYLQKVGICGTIWQSGRWEEMISYLFFTLEVKHGVKKKHWNGRKKENEEARKQTRKGNTEYF